MNRADIKKGVRTIVETTSPYIQYIDINTNRTVVDIDYYYGDENILYVLLVNKYHTHKIKPFKVYGLKIQHFE